MRNAADAKHNPIQGDEFQYSHRGLQYGRDVVAIKFDLRKRPVVCYYETNIEGEGWHKECLLTSFRRWAKQRGVTAERVQQEAPMPDALEKENKP